MFAFRMKLVNARKHLITSSYLGNFLLSAKDFLSTFKTCSMVTDLIMR